MEIFIYFAIVVVLVIVMIKLLKAQSDVSNSRKSIDKPTINIKQNFIQKPSCRVGQMKPTKITNSQQMQPSYQKQYQRIIYLQSLSSLHYITAIDIKTSKIILSTSNNQLIIYHLTYNQQPDKYYTSLNNNTGTTLAIGHRYYYVALSQDKTISYYELIGGSLKQVNKFKNNLLCSNSIALMIPDSERYIVSCGSQTDTVVQVWSMVGQKLSHLNTYQVYHYAASTCSHNILVRGWTAGLKLFQILENQDGSFLKLSKSKYLPHQQAPIYSSIDNLGLYAITLSKNHEITLWNIKSNHHQSIHLSHLQLNTIQLCSIYTKQYQNHKLKTLVILTDANKILICDKGLKIIGILNAINCRSIFIMGLQRDTLMFTFNTQYTVITWSMNRYLESIKEDEEQN